MRTLKRALGIAAANPDIAKVAVAMGRYDAESGEVFAYAIPPNVAIVGPAGGGAIIVGSSDQPGLEVTTGALQDLELEGFSVAVTARGGAAEIVNVRVRSSGVAVRGEASSMITLNNLDVTGAGPCPTGVELNGDARLTATGFRSRALGSSFILTGDSSAAISNARITGLQNCGLAVFSVVTTKAFSLADSVVDGGGEGVAISAAAATLTNNTLRNLRDAAVGGSRGVFQITGGEISNTGTYGISAVGGTWAVTAVQITNTLSSGIFVEDASLVLRGSTIAGAPAGVFLFDNAIADLGTTASPGNNVLRDNITVGLGIDGIAGARQIDAVGNTWRPNVQGANAAGAYPTGAPVPGPVAFRTGNNYAISSGWSLQL